LISERDFLTSAAKAFQALQNTPGRLVQSVEEASFDAWIKYYRQDENSINSQVSYYDKGAILGLLLDLEIRTRSNGAKSLDDVMRYLYNEFFKKDRNYTPEDFQRICETMAGTSLEAFFAKYVRGRDELNYNEALAAAGLQLVTTGASANGVLPKPDFGADLVQEQDRLIVKRVYAGSPAYEQGLNAGDQIVAMNNMRLSKEFFDARLAEKKPGDIINLTIFRSDDLSTLIIKLGDRVSPTYRINAIENSTERQKRIYQSWLNGPLTK
jgi:predicted metalloprotease with PDZ domain